MHRSSDIISAVGFKLGELGGHCFFWIICRQFACKWPYCWATRAVYTDPCISLNLPLFHVMWTPYNVLNCCVKSLKTLEKCYHFLSRVSMHSTQSAILFLSIIPFVRLSVRHIVVLYFNECTYRPPHFSHQLVLP